MRPCTRPLRSLQNLSSARQCTSTLALPYRTRSLITTSPHAIKTHARRVTSKQISSIPSSRQICAAPFHTTAHHARRAHNNEEIPDAAPTTDFSRMDMLGQTPAPSTSVDICSSDGFKLNSGVSIYDGKGVLLVGGEAFEWQPWGSDMRLVNAKGQWEVPEGAWALLDLLWPRPGMVSSIRALYTERRIYGLTAFDVQQTS